MYITSFVDKEIDSGRFVKFMWLSAYLNLIVYVKTLLPSCVNI